MIAQLRLGIIQALPSQLLDTWTGMWPNWRTGSCTGDVYYPAVLHHALLVTWPLSCQYCKKQGGYCPTVWTSWTPAAALFLLSRLKKYGSSDHSGSRPQICLVTIKYDPLKNSFQLSHHTVANVKKSPFTLTKCNPSAACFLASWADWPSGWRMW